LPTTGNKARFHILNWLNNDNKERLTPLNTAIFDTLAYAKKLKGAGVPENQAEIHAEAIAGLIDEQVATKKDLQILEANVTARIIRWVAGMLVAQAAIVATLVKLL